jgi:hypothetical protein
VAFVRASPEQASPRSATHRIQPHPHSFRQQDESNNRQACQGAYDQCQDQNYLILTLSQFGHAI